VGDRRLGRVRPRHLAGSNPGSKVSATTLNSARREPAPDHRIGSDPSGSLRLGAGRSQVQILSPRLEAPANRIVLVSGVMASRGPVWIAGSKFFNRAGSGVWRHDVACGRLFAPGPESHRFDHVRTSSGQKRHPRWLRRLLDASAGARPQSFPGTTRERTLASNASGISPCRTPGGGVVDRAIPSAQPRRTGPGCRASTHSPTTVERVLGGHVGGHVGGQEGTVPRIALTAEGRRRDRRGEGNEVEHAEDSRSLLIAGHPVKTPLPSPRGDAAADPTLPLTGLEANL
jgi:hypothetical protein